MKKLINKLFLLFNPDIKELLEHKENFYNWAYKHVYKKNEERNKSHLNYYARKNSPNVKYFTCSGAGKIFISSELSMNLETCGFQFGVEWGIHGFCAGHISIKELKKMTEWINCELDKIEISGKVELDIVNKNRKELNLDALPEIPSYI
jgi:hypothetical protein